MMRAIQLLQTGLLLTFRVIEPVWHFMRAESFR